MKTPRVAIDIYAGLSSVIDLRNPSNPIVHTLLTPKGDVEMVRAAPVAYRPVVELPATPVVLDGKAPQFLD